MDNKSILENCSNKINLLEKEKEEKIKEIIKKKNSGFMGWLRRRFGFFWNREIIKDLPIILKIDNEILEQKLAIAWALERKHFEEWKNG